MGMSIEEATRLKDLNFQCDDLVLRNRKLADELAKLHKAKSAWAATAREWRQTMMDQRQVIAALSCAVLPAPTVPASPSPLELSCAHLERKNADLHAQVSKLTMDNTRLRIPALDPVEFHPVLHALQMCQISTGKAQELLWDWLLGAKPKLPEVDEGLKFVAWSKADGIVGNPDALDSAGFVMPTPSAVRRYMEAARSHGYDVSDWVVAAVVEVDEECP